MAFPALAGIGKGLMGAAKGMMGGGAKEGGKAMAGKAMADKMFGRGNKEDQMGGGDYSDKRSSSIVLRPKVNFNKFINKTEPKEVNVDSDNPKIDPLKQVIDGMNTLVASIQETMDSKLRIEKEKKEYEKQKELKEKRSERLKKIVSGVKNIAKKTGVTSLFDMVENFVKNVLFGTILTFLIENTEKIITTIQAVGQKIVEFKEKFDEVMETLDTYLFTPLKIVFKAIVGPVSEGIAKIMGVPSTEAEENTISENLVAIGKQIPIIGPIIKDIEKMFSNVGKEKPGTTPTTATGGGGGSQYNTESGGLVAGGGVEMGTQAKQQVSEAGFNESEFTLFRDVVANIESGGEYDIQGGSGNMYAGRYQMGAAARQDAARYLGEEYQGDSEAARKAFRQDPAMQERYFAAYTRANHETLMKLSPEYRGLSREGKLQVLGYAHNAGAGNAVKWLKSGMSESFRDGFGTRSDKYSESIRRAQEQRKTGEVVLPPVDRGGIKPGNFFPEADIEVGERAGFSKSRGRVHAGRDIAAYSGTPLTVPSASEITDVGNDPFYGHYVVFRDSNGMEHLYGHMRESTKYRKGQTINVGEIIGYVGSTGRSSGPHLHWEISPRPGEVGYPRQNVIDPIESGYHEQVPFTGAQVEKTSSEIQQKISKSPSYETKDHVAIVDIPTSAPVLSRGGGGTPSGSSSGSSLNRIQQHEYLQFLYKA